MSVRMSVSLDVYLSVLACLSMSIHVCLHMPVSVINLLRLAGGDDVEDAGDLILHEGVDSLLHVLGLVSFVLLGDVMLGESRHLLQFLSAQLLLVIFVEITGKIRGGVACVRGDIFAVVPL